MAITNEHINIAIKLGKEFGATKILLFGSALDDPDNARDLDLGVEGIEPSKFFLFGATLEDLILRTVDIVPLNSNSSFVEHIKKYGKYIYDKSIVN
jgi:predicted nucleotidyltransferase